MTENTAVSRLLKVWTTYDAEANDMMTIENAIAAARFHLNRNPYWSKLDSVVSDISLALNQHTKHTRRIK